MFLRELEAVRDGRPTKNWAKLREKLDLPPPPPLAASAGAPT
jgi:hypothetical protein